VTGFVPRKFRERSAVVEAVQLTDADDWDIVGVWCDGQVYDSLGFIAVGVKHAGVGDWICRRGDGTHTVLSPAEFKDRQLIADDDRGGLRVVSTAAELRRLGEAVVDTGAGAVLRDGEGDVWIIRRKPSPNGLWHAEASRLEEYDPEDCWCISGPAEPRGLQGLYPFTVLHGPEVTP